MTTATATQTSAATAIIALERRVNQIASNFGVSCTADVAAIVKSGEVFDFTLTFNKPFFSKTATINTALHQLQSLFDGEILSASAYTATVRVFI